MKIKIKLIFLILIYFNCFSSLFAFDIDPIGKRVKEGVERYKAQDFQGSLESFNQAEAQAKEDDRLFFNKGTSYYKLNDYKLALKYFEKSAMSSDRELKLRSLYNKGNAYAKLGDKKNAIKSYMEALNTDSEFLPARKNLELLTKKEEKDQKDQKQDQKKNEESEKDEQKEKDQNNSTSQNKKGKSEKQNEQEEQKDREPEPNKKITKEEAERILESAKQNKINRKKMTQRQPERNEVFW